MKPGKDALGRKNSKDKANGTLSWAAVTSLVVPRVTVIQGAEWFWGPGTGIPIIKCC